MVRRATPVRASRSRPASPESLSMATVAKVRLLTEDLPEHRALEALFLPERRSGAVRVSSYLTSSAAIGAAEMSLLERPDVAVALVLNADTEDPLKIEERRQVVRRILYRSAPTGWLLSVA